MKTQELRIVKWNLKKLESISKSLNRLDCAACNYGLSKKQEDRITKLEKQAEDYAQQIGLHAYHQSDPRGCSLYLVDTLENVDRVYTDGIAL
jgi:hypothetical protein